MSVTGGMPLRRSPQLEAVQGTGRFFGLPWQLTVFLLVQGLVWLVMPAIATTSMHPSTAEIVMWGREWYWVNYKHPGLTSWTMDLVYAVLGIHPWVPFLVSQIFVCTAYVFVFLLGRELLDEARAIAGPMLLVGLSYFSLFTLKFNHNIAQLPFWAMFCYGLWKASETNRAGWWSLAAAAAALGLYTKFSTGLPIALGSVWIVYDSKTRARLRTPAPYVGLALFLAMMAPLVIDLYRIDFLTIQWISQESDERGVSMRSFLETQSVNLLRVLALAAAAGAIGFRRAVRAPQDPAPDPGARRKLAFLLLLGAGPLLLTAALTPFIALRNAWTVPMYNLVGLVLLGIWPRAVLARAGARLIAVVLLVSFGLAAQIAWEQYRNRTAETDPTQYSFPMQEIAQRFDAIWAQQVNAPLRLVGGDAWPAALVGVYSTDRPAMFSNLDVGQSPTVTPERIAREGMLVVWLSNKDAPAEQWTRGRTIGTETFRWSNAPMATPIVVSYVIIPPKP